MSAPKAGATCAPFSAPPARSTTPTSAPLTSAACSPSWAGMAETLAPAEGPPHPRAGREARLAAILATRTQPHRRPRPPARTSGTPRLSGCATSSATASAGAPPVQGYRRAVDHPTLMPKSTPALRGRHRRLADTSARNRRRAVGERDQRNCAGGRGDLQARRAPIWKITANPFVNVERPRPQRVADDFDVLTAETMLLAAHAADDQDAAFYITAAFTGLRLGELRALRIGRPEFHRPARARSPRIHARPPQARIRRVDAGAQCR